MPILLERITSILSYFFFNSFSKLMLFEFSIIIFLDSVGSESKQFLIILSSSIPYKYSGFVQFFLNPSVQNEERGLNLKKVTTTALEHPLDWMEA